LLNRAFWGGKCSSYRGERLDRKSRPAMGARVPERKKVQDLPPAKHCVKQRERKRAVSSEDYEPSREKHVPPAGGAGQERYVSKGAMLGKV